MELLVLLVTLLVLISQLGNAASGMTRDVACDELCERDKFGFEAIQILHKEVDDDANGNLDRSESDEFIRDELKYEDGFDRHTKFHGSDDLISVSDLWHLWTQSEVYNWTVDDTIDWLVNHVQLPQYVDKFKANAVDGRTISRIATDSEYVGSILGIRNKIHKQLLTFKSKDVVLFGPPLRGHSYIKDVALVASLVIALGGCWLAYMQHRYSQSHLRKVMKDLETLQSAEDALSDLQHKLEKAHQEQKSVTEEKHSLEQKMREEIHGAKAEADRLRTARETTEEEISRLRLAEEELVQVRMALRKAEQDLEDYQHAKLGDLQQWLQLTYELESRHYEAKRESAEKHLMVAKEMCEKIKRKRGAFLGSLRIAHTTSMDDTDQKIMSARSALEEVKMDLQERTQRWRQMEKICCFNIITNPGIPFLESYLRGNSNLISTNHLSGSMVAPSGVEEGDEDLPPGYLTAQAMPPAAMGLLAGELRERRNYGLSGSSGSLNSMPSTSGMTSTLHKPSPLVAKPADHTAQCDSRDVSENDESPSVASTASANLNGGPRFYLGETSSSPNKSGDLEETVNISPNLKQSLSLDLSSSHSLSRPQTIATSMSDSSTLASPGYGMVRSKSNVQKRIGGHSPTPGTPSVDEENSSPESTDSYSLDDSKDPKKKKVPTATLR